MRYGLFRFQVEVEVGFVFTRRNAAVEAVDGCMNLVDGCLRVLQRVVFAVGEQCMNTLILPDDSGDRGCLAFCEKVATGMQDNIR